MGQTKSSAHCFVSFSCECGPHGQPRHRPVSGLEPGPCPPLVSRPFYVIARHVIHRVYKRRLFTSATSYFLTSTLCLRRWQRWLQVLNSMMSAWVRRVRVTSARSRRKVDNFNDAPVRFIIPLIVEHRRTTRQILDAVAKRRPRREAQAARRSGGGKRRTLSVVCTR